ncbi:MAG: hypothetical protein KDE33_09895 [Bacteroidetes bacterium]|nr:hypothetical protein [Bacteroidota bacterium]
MKKLLYTLTILILIAGCKKDKQSNEIINGGTIYTYQLVHIEVDNINQESYIATLGDKEIEVVKANEKEIAFLVPQDIKLGANRLIIPALDNFAVDYQINKTALVTSANETLVPFFNGFSQITTQLENPTQIAYINDALQNFNTHYTDFTEEEKTKLAEFYIANQELFTEIFEIDFTELIGKTTGDYSNLSDKQLILNFEKAVLLAGIATAIAVLDPEPTTKWIAAIAAAGLYYKTYNVLSAILERNMKTNNMIIDGIISVLGKKASGEIILTDGTLSTLPFEYSNRAIDNQDNNSSNSFINLFFGSFNSLNTIINKINNAIEFVNDALFFSNMGLLDNVALNNANESIDAVNSTIFNNLSFSVGNSNVSIDQATLGNGNLNLILSINNTSGIIDYVETELNYTYNDDLNQIQGSFPIMVLKDNISPTSIDLLSHYWSIDGLCGFGSFSFIFNNDNTVILNSHYHDNQYAEYTFGNISYNLQDEVLEMHIPYSRSYNNCGNNIVATQEGQINIITQYYVDNIYDTEFFSDSITYTMTEVDCSGTTYDNSSNNNNCYLFIKRGSEL